MTITEYIKVLEQIREEHGDLPVVLLNDDDDGNYYHDADEPHATKNIEARNADVEIDEVSIYQKCLLLN